MIKVAVVGAGTKVLNHLEAWSAINNVQVVGVTDPSEDNLAKEIEQHGVHLFSNLVDLLSQTDVDVVDICMSANLHFDYVRQAANAINHFICELPLILGDEEYETMLHICEKNNVQLHIGNTLRFSPEYVDARKRVKEGAIGTPGVVRISRVCPYPRGKDFKNKDAAQSGIFRHLGIREFDWLRWTFGDVQRVMAKRVKRSEDNGSQLEYTLITLKMEDGTIAHVELSSTGSISEASFELAGDKGMITNDSQDSCPVRLQLAEPSNDKVFGSVTPESLPGKKPYQREFQYFLDCILDGEPSLVSGYDILKAIEIARAVAQSVEIGQPVELMERGDA